MRATAIALFVTASLAWLVIGLVTDDLLGLGGGLLYILGISSGIAAL